MNQSEEEENKRSKERAAKEKDQITNTILNLECVKRMLYQQIQLNKTLENEKKSFEMRHKTLDEELDTTISVYRTVLEDTEKKSSDAMMKEEIKKQVQLHEQILQEI